MIKAYLSLTFCIIMLGSNFVFGKILVQHFSPSLVTFLRLLFIVLFLLIIAVFKKGFARISNRDLIMILALGLFGIFLNQLSFFIGLQTADPTTSALILATTPIFTGVMAGSFLKEKISGKMLVGSFVAIAGIYTVVTDGSFTAPDQHKGLLWIVVTMVTFSFMILITRVLSARVKPLTITLYSNIAGLIFASPFVLLPDSRPLVSSKVSMWFFLIGTAIVVHGFATLIWNNNIRYVEASKAAMLSNLEPFAAMLAGLLLLYKPVTFAEVAGSLLIIAGVVLSTYERRRGPTEMQ